MFIPPSAVRAVRLAGADQDVLVRRLHRDVADATQSEVRFPPGWSRPGAGAFDVAEEVLWLEGALHMSGRYHPAGTYGWFPAGFVRAASAAPGGARALAWFSGPPTWTPRPAEGGPAPVVFTVADITPRPSPLRGAPGRLLREGPDGHATWLLESVPGGAAPRGGLLLVPLDGRGAWQVPAGEAMPGLAQAVLVRTRRA